ncbi:hypothetical protein [Nonomuraea salmonea]|uniref:hypothetical protein n=1 Tax=Nonomuraea salmonea TaxID=46181 RepID=UPI002FE875E6
MTGCAPCASMAGGGGGVGGGDVQLARVVVQPGAAERAAQVAGQVLLGDGGSLLVLEAGDDLCFRQAEVALQSVDHLGGVRRGRRIEVLGQLMLG